jgi:RHS repeat-associated protein
MASVTTTLDTTAPVLAFTSPANGSFTDSSALLVTGTVADPVATTVLVNGTVAVVSGGTFQATVALSQGANTITATATDAAGNVTSAGLTVTLDTTPPVVTIAAPASGTQVASSPVTVSGTISATDPIASLTVNGQSVTPGSSFTATASLSPGANTITVQATDAAGNTGSAQVTVTLASGGTPLTISFTAPVDGSATSMATVAVAGTVSDPTASVIVNQIPAAVTGTTFQVTGVPVSVGSNLLTASASSAAGSASAQVVVVRESTPLPTLPPDPSTVAPAINPTTPTNMADATAFLYRGANPIQTGVPLLAIDPLQAGVLRGRVLTRIGAPLPGVTVTVANHPEFGQTISRADGYFDMAVNGGSVLTVNYALAGYITAQRQTEMPWRDFVVLPDVVLLPYDPTVTSINLGSTAPVQVARGSVVTDASGARQATLLFKQGTAAQMVFPNGISQSLSQFSIRMTETTVGPFGPEEMPAELPPTSAYTYNVEFTVDEALAAGAQSVQLSQPALLYVENFIGFPVGTSVPLGDYDLVRSAWIAGKSGVVVKILSIQNGIAQLDVDGSGQPASSAALTALGIDGTELTALAGLYGAGQSLTRLAIPHFCDGNFALPDPPGLLRPFVNSPSFGTPCEECTGGHSIISYEAQSLGESVPVVGTPFALHYESERTPGYREAYTVQIPITGSETIPSSLLEIDLTIQIAGRVFKQTFPPNPNQTYTFTWDGLDAYGRALQGRQPITTEVDYLYDLGYANTSTFGVPGNGSAIPGVTGRGRFKAQQISKAEIGAWDARGVGLGGWTITPHHTYDPQSQALYLGDGTRRQADQLAAVITTTANGNGTPGSPDGQNVANVGLGCFVCGGTEIAVAPDGSYYVAVNYAFQNGTQIYHVDRSQLVYRVAGRFGGLMGAAADGQPAVNAAVGQCDGLAVGPDGSVYFSDLEISGQSESSRVRRILPNGILTTVAGGAPTGYGGDGGPALGAQLSNSINGIALAPDGSIYIADSGNIVIRRVDPAGTISTVAGTGPTQFGPSIDGVPATQSFLGRIWSVAVGKDGSFYISADGTYSGQIRRVSVGGIITTVAGSTTPGGTTGEGVPATGVFIQEPMGKVLVGPEGSLYITDSAGSRIRRVTPDGLIRTIAGTGIRGENGDGGPAVAAKIQEPFSIALHPDGSILFPDFFPGIRRIAPPLPGYTAGDILVPSEDGSELYHFDASGRHLTTLETVRNSVVYTFAYNSGGRLNTITDAYGNVTSVSRDSSGSPTAVVSPYGQQTSLLLDSGGFLSRIMDPASESHTMVSTPTGLLTSYTTPNGNQSVFGYDSFGRLALDQDAAGGSIALARTLTANGYQVAVTTGVGRATDYLTETLSSGVRRRAVTDPASLTTLQLRGTDDSRKTSEPDGTTISTTVAGDPRFGLEAPIQASAITATPGGLTRSENLSRTTSVDANGILMNQTDTQILNGRASIRSYTASTGVAQTTTAGGRVFQSMLDAFGRVAQTQLGTLSPLGFAYDSHGRLGSLSQGAGSAVRQTSLVYDGAGFLAQITDPLQRTVGFTRDAAGRITKQNLPDGRQIAFTYDGNGNLSSLTPPGGAPHVFVYTPVDLQSRYQPPVVSGITNPQTVYTYDSDRELVRVDRPDGAAVLLAYDSAGRLSTVSTPRGTSSYAFDPTTGNLSGITAPGGVGVGYAYDGSLPTSTTWSGAVAGSVSHTYDNDFRVSSESVNGTSPVSFAYDADSLLIGAGAMTLTRDPGTGLLTGTALGNLSTSIGYSAFAERTSDSASYSGTALYATAYVRDALGRITEKTERIQSVTTVYDYHYDLAGRLDQVKQNGAVTTSYSYDSNSNRISKTDASGTVSGVVDAQDRLLSYGTKTYAYTANGELASKIDLAASKTTSYSYDVLGNLMSVTLPGGPQIDYVVDGQNHRIGKKVNGTLMKGFLYTNRREIVAELDGTGAVISQFVYGTKTNVPDYMVKAGQTFRIVTDNLGSPRLAVNVSTGAIAQRMDYDEFGNVIQDTSPGFQPFGFAGGLYDSDTKLVRFGSRDYDAETARWSAKDPIWFAGLQVNLYGYVLNDPVNSKDPLGLRDWCDPADPTNKLVLDFIQANQAAADVLAAQINVPPEWILGLAGEESTWGTSPIALNAHNYFGLHKGAPGSTGKYKTSAGKEVSSFPGKDGFTESGQSFVDKYGAAVRDDETLSDFSQDLIDARFNTENANFATVVEGAVKAVENRINCGARCPENK